MKGDGGQSFNNRRLEKYLRVHVFGAGAGIGRWFIDKGVFCDLDVFGYDVDQDVENFNPKTTKTFEGIHLDRKDGANDYLADAAGNIISGDWIFLAIPEKFLKELLPLLKSHLPDKCLVIGMSSRQEGPLELISSKLKNSMVCGLHPLFGPAVISPLAQVVAIVTDTDDGFGGRIDFLQELLEQAGLQAVSITPQQHDKAMSIVQGLTHFSLLTFYSVLSKSDQKLTDLIKTKTPPFQFLSAFGARVLMGNPSTYSALQRSDDAAEIRSRFIESAIELNQAFSDPDYVTGEQKIEAIRKPFSGGTLDTLNQFSLIADAAILQKELRYRLNEIIVFRTGTSGSYRVGRIEEKDNLNVFIRELLTKITIDKERKGIPIPFSKDAELEYARSGVQIRWRFDLIPVKKGHIEILSPYRMQQWFLENALTVTRVFDLHNPKRFSRRDFEKAFPKNIPELKKCTYKLLESKPDEIQKVRLTATYVPIHSRDEMEARLRSYCYALT